MAATAGLGMLLETAAQQKQPLPPPRHARTPAAHQIIISKATLTNAENVVINDTSTATSSSASAFSCSSSASHAPVSSPAATTACSFLQRCFLCRRELADGRDIYIYRGDRAFCSEECRCRHILVVEDDDDDDCARVTAADRSRRRRRHAVPAGR
ncbi:unnamed protein product [Urochloa decumbens]|uniref:FLZ-type domain-containing protein n=1 Tax=Urochloa decumbens TaxID=240449 RepID=A0ABC9AI02_9POAL